MRNVLIGSAVIFLSSCPGMVFGHATQLYVSTPFAPSRNLLWVPLLYAALMLAWGHWTIRRFGSEEAAPAVFRWALVISVGVAFLAGLLMAALNTAPPPGFGLPHPPFRGYGWSKVGILFVIGNVFGLLVMLKIMVFTSRRLFHQGRARSRFLIGCAGIYLLCLLPSITSHSLTHGWHGGYVAMTCRIHRDLWRTCLSSYADAHGRKLPEGATFREVAANAESY